MIHRLSELISLKCGLRFGLLLLALQPAVAVERTLRLEAPATVVTGQTAEVVISASTDAGQGEQVGFLQAEMSVDDGRTWTAICYLQKSGSSITQPASLTPGPAGTTVKVRVRAAFRDGLAGDVDYTGAALRWHASWNEWKTPPAKHASIAVVAR
jgi:hypothetical protein